MIAMMLEDYLDLLGYGVHGVAVTLEEGRQKAMAGGFDLAILDCNLGGEAVWPLADLLAEMGIPFLLSTGASAADIEPKHGTRPVLEKPFTMQDVANLLEKIYFN